MSGDNYLQDMVSRGYVSFGDLETSFYFQLVFLSIDNDIVTTKYVHKCDNDTLQIELKRKLETITNRDELEKTKGFKSRYACTLKMTFNGEEIKIKNCNGIMDTSKNCNCFTRRYTTVMPIWDGQLFDLIALSRSRPIKK